MADRNALKDSIRLSTQGWNIWSALSGLGNTLAATILFKRKIHQLTSEHDRVTEFLCVQKK